MKNFFFYLATFISVTFWCTALNAQTPNTASPSSDTTKYLIIKNDGNEYVGLILSDDGREVLIETKSLGKIYIPKSDIKSMRPIDYAEDVAKGEFSSAGVFTTRYQFTTNCFPIKKGENYAMVNLYGPEVHFAVHKDFSVGVMSTWIGSPIALALKYTRGTSNPKINYGVGTLLGTSGYLNQGRGFGGLHWGMITYGDRRNNATLSVGYGYFNDGNYQVNQVPVYVPGTYAAVDDGNGFYSRPYIDSYQIKNEGMIKAPILGIAGLTSVGKKASFVMDAMFILGSYNQVNNDQTVNDYFNPITNQLAYTTVSNVTSTSNSYKANLMVFMPGMRFQTTENRAFQVSLSGVFLNIKGSNSTNNRFSFPLPMCSWYFKF